jgi:hypothetical protein
MSENTWETNARQYATRFSIHLVSELCNRFIVIKKHNVLSRTRCWLKLSSRGHGSIENSYHTLHIPNLTVLSRVTVSVTNNNGFWI